MDIVMRILDDLCRSCMNMLVYAHLHTCIGQVLTCMLSLLLPGTIKNFFLHHIIKNSTLMSLG